MPGSMPHASSSSKAAAAFETLQRPLLYNVPCMRQAGNLFCIKIAQPI